MMLFNENVFSLWSKWMCFDGGGSGCVLTVDEVDVFDGDQNGCSVMLVEVEVL